LVDEQASGDLKVYCLDTSALIHAEARSYPAENFGTFWDKLDGLAKSGRIVIPRDACDELETKADDIFAWVKARRQMIVEIDIDVQRIVRDILRDHPRLVDTKKGRSGADPWVIAVAELRQLAVVTQELPAGIHAKSPKIPDVCNKREIRWMNLLDMIQMEEWRF